MIPSLTHIGIGHPGTLENLVTLAARNGFPAVDTNADMLNRCVVTLGVEGARGHLREEGVQLGALWLPVDWRQDGDTFQRGLIRLAEAARQAADLGCRRSSTWMMPSVAEPPHHVALTLVRRVRTIASILNCFGISLAIEYVAPFHLRNLHPHPFIYNLAGMLEFVDAVDRPGVGVLLDPIHWHCAGETLADLAALDLSRIVHVHLDDVPAGPVEMVRDNGRVLPGEGVLDLKGFLGLLRAKGYSGFVATEILTAEPPKVSPEEMAARVAAATLPFFR